MLTLFSLAYTVWIVRNPNPLRVERHRSFIRFIRTKDLAVFEVQRPVRRVDVDRHHRVYLETDDETLTLPHKFRGHQHVALMRFLEAAVETNDE